MSNYILEEKMKPIIIDQAIAKIKEEGTTEFYSKALFVIISGVLMQLFPEEIFKKIIE
jgi:hypothetical protein